MHSFLILIISLVGSVVGSLGGSVVVDIGDVGSPYKQFKNLYFIPSTSSIHYHSIAIISIHFKSWLSSLCDDGEVSPYNDVTWGICCWIGDECVIVENDWEFDWIMGLLLPWSIVSINSLAQLVPKTTVSAEVFVTLWSAVTNVRCSWACHVATF